MCSFMHLVAAPCCISIACMLSAIFICTVSRLTLTPILIFPIKIVLVFLPSFHLQCEDKALDYMLRFDFYVVACIIPFTPLQTPPPGCMLPKYILRSLVFTFDCVQTPPQVVCRPNIYCAACLPLTVSSPPPPQSNLRLFLFPFA